MHDSDNVEFIVMVPLLLEAVVAESSQPSWASTYLPTLDVDVLENSIINH